MKLMLLTQKLKKKKVFELSDIGPVNFIIGIKLIKKNEDIIIHQLQYFK